MHTPRFNILHIAISALLLLTSIPEIYAGSNDSIINDEKKPNLIQKIIKYFETSNKTVLTRKPNFSFVGGPHYSSDKKFGIGLLAAGLYSTEPEDSTLNPSNVSIFANITTAKFYKVGVGGLHLYKKETRRIDYEVSLNSYSTYFWGIGYENASDDNNKCKYLLTDVHINADHLWRIGNSIYMGPILDFDYISARKIRNARTWENIPHNTTSLGLGAKIQFDTRDNYTAPKKGWFGEFTQIFYPKLTGNGSHHFTMTEVSLNNYTKIWEGGVIASRIHGCFTYGKTPWGLMPTLGEHGMMRGYYEGQYRDKCELDLTAEWRQHLYGRVGMVCWIGFGSVFPRLNELKGKYLLPTYGVGYRWEFKKNTNVRVDVGFGKKCWGVVFNINEVF